MKGENLSINLVPKVVRNKLNSSLINKKRVLAFKK